MSNNFENTFSAQDSDIESVIITEILNPDGTVAESFSEENDNKKKKRTIKIDSNSPWYLKLLAVLLIVPVVMLFMLISMVVGAFAIVVSSIFIILAKIIMLFSRKKN